MKQTQLKKKKKCKVFLYILRFIRLFPSFIYYFRNKCVEYPCERSEVNSPKGQDKTNLKQT